MSKKPKLSERVAVKTREPRNEAPVKPPEPVIPAVDAVQRTNTAIQKTLKFKEILLQNRIKHSMFACCLRTMRQDIAALHTRASVKFALTICVGPRC